LEKAPIAVAPAAAALVCVPRAELFKPPAFAASPNAEEDAPAALAPMPTAALLTPLAALFKPKADAPVLVALALVPMATESDPVALALLAERADPIATPPTPLASAFDPIAIVSVAVAEAAPPPGALIATDGAPVAFPLPTPNWARACIGESPIAAARTTSIAAAERRERPPRCTLLKLNSTAKIDFPITSSL
jgi:hypothetical protein